MRARPFASALAVFLFSLVMPAAAFAQPVIVGGGQVDKLLSAPQRIGELLAFKLGPGVLLLGIVFGAFAWISAKPDALDIAKKVAIGGLILFGAGAIVELLASLVA